jgi:hypothetical protein
MSKAKKQALTPEEIVQRKEVAPPDIAESSRRTPMPAAPVRAVSTAATYRNSSTITADTPHDLPQRAGNPWVATDAGRGSSPKDA